MDARVEEKRLLPAIAKAVEEWFGVRAIAVADATITRDRVPTLPLVVVVFINSRGNQLSVSTSSDFHVVDTFAVQFWMKPERYKNADQSETPFWSYYPYEIIRQTLLNNFIEWEAPNCEHIAYRGMSVMADELAVTLTFTFEAAFGWDFRTTRTGEIIKLVDFRLCTPQSCVIEDLCPEAVDPCL